MAVQLHARLPHSRKFTRIGGILLKRGLGLLTLILVTPGIASATAFTIESDWRTAVGNVFALETFDSLSAGSDVTTLTGLGISLDPLNDGTQPTVQPYSSTGGVIKSGPNNLLNDRDFSLPGRGPITVRPINSGDFLFGLGMWNVGGDDSLRLTFYDAADNPIESVLSGPSFGFFGIVNSTGAVRAVVDFVGGNQYSPTDDWQTAARPTFEPPPTTVPEPASLLLVGAGLARVAMVRRRKRA
jgi:hypothetical protein